MTPRTPKIISELNPLKMELISLNITKVFLSFLNFQLQLKFCKWKFFFYEALCISPQNQEQEEEPRKYLYQHEWVAKSIKCLIFKISPSFSFSRFSSDEKKKKLLQQGWMMGKMASNYFLVHSIQLLSYVIVSFQLQRSTI